MMNECFNPSNVVFWLNLGNIGYLAAFSVRDMLWLRVLTVVATLCLLPYYYCSRETPLVAPMVWAALFTLVNIVQIVLLMWERRPVFMGDEEVRLYKNVFRALRPSEFVELMSIAEPAKLAAGDVILRQNDRVENLTLVSTGSGVVEVNGKFVAQVRPHQFIGEMGFLSRDSASATVVATSPMSAYTWDVSKLRSQLEGSREMRTKVHGILGLDVVQKLRERGVETKSI